jgi:hypothetical protein
MLRITTQAERQPATLLLEGVLAGPWVAEVRLAWQRLREQVAGRLVLDLTGVSHVSGDGKNLLARLWQEGAELRATGCFTSALIQDIAEKRSGQNPEGEN